MGLKKHTEYLSVFGRTSGTNTPPKSTKSTMENATQGTLLPSHQVKSPTLTSSVLASLAKRLASLEKGKDLRTLEGLSFLKSLGFSPTKDPDIFFSKTSRVWLVTTGAKLCKSYLGFLPTWGIEISSGVWLIRRATSPRIVRGYSLSDILETEVDERYFLSEKMTAYIQGHLDKIKSQTALIQTTGKGG